MKIFKSQTLCHNSPCFPDPVLIRHRPVDLPDSLLAVAGLSDGHLLEARAGVSGSRPVRSYRVLRPGHEGQFQGKLKYDESQAKVNQPLDS